MRGQRWTAVLVACFLMGTGCSAAAAQSYTIAGTVVNAQTGEPVAHADVAALSAGDSHALMSMAADEGGHFALAGLAAAKYQLSASRRGFRTEFYDEHGDFNSAIVAGPGQDTTHLVFRLEPDAALRGVVRDDAGDAAANASVLLFRKPDSPAERVTQVGTAMTDDTGAYEFGELAPGAYLLAVRATPWYEVSPRPGQTGNPALDVAFPVTYYDSTTDESDAAAIALTAGARAEANVTLQAVPALHLEVSAPSEGAKGPGGANGSIDRVRLQESIFGTLVSAGFEEATGAPMAGAQDSGAQQSGVEFTGVAPGEYELQQGDPPRMSELNATESGPVDPTQGAALVEVQGRLQAAAGSVLPAGMSVVLTPVGEAYDREPVSADAHNGAFHFQAAAGSTWQMAVTSTAEPEADLTVLAVRAGAQAQAGGEFAVGSQPMALTAEVSAAATKVTGFARKDGKAWAGAMIVLVPSGPVAPSGEGDARFAGLVRRDQSDSDGSFTLADVVPGTYTVVAIDDGWTLDWSSPAVMSRYVAGGVAVTVKADAGKSVSLSGAVSVENP